MIVKYISHLGGSKNVPETGKNLTSLVICTISLSNALAQTNLGCFSLGYFWLHFGVIPFGLFWRDISAMGNFSQCEYLRNELIFCNVHGIMNTSGLVQSK